MSFAQRSLRRARDPGLSRRGAALLFVLAALALVLPVCLGLARVVTDAALERGLRRDERLVQEFLIEADAPIQEFLAAEAGDVILRPDSPYPALLVLDDRFEAGAAALELRIVAWDQCGLVPLDVARSASPIRLALPREVIETLEANRRRGELPGLDWFAEEDGESPFPPAPSVQHIDGGTRLSWPGSAQRVVGAWVATHNTAKLNVSTAPLAILEAALRELQRGGIDRVVAARQKGEHVPIPPAGTDAPQDEPRRIKLVSTSDCFAFRVDARAGKVRRSFWLVYQPGAVSEADQPRWRCVQRLLITTG